MGVKEEMKTPRFYAKSSPVLTVAEHVQDVKEGISYLHDMYGNEIPNMTAEDWTLLEMVALYHDIGKYSDGFQKLIQSAISKTAETTEGINISCNKSPSRNLFNYPHNYLSVALMPFNTLMKRFNRKQVMIALLAVGFHHEKRMQPTKEDVLAFFNQQVKPNVPYLEKDMQGMGIEVAHEADIRSINVLTARTRFIQSDSANDWFKRYVMIKGLLQRIDHSVSAKPQNGAYSDYVEQDVALDIGEQTKLHLSQYGLRPMQQWAYQNQHKNLILIAQTGSGKTETALLWAGKSKTFLTLPLRTSLNALYDRLTASDGIGFKRVGLLHQTALDYLLDSDNDDEMDYLTSVDHTKRFANKLTLSTIDQLMKFPLFYKGFETELATLAYSKVIIDEIQSYDPHIVAIVLRALKIIHDMGGKWLIMTATMPQIFHEGLARLGLLDDSVEEAMYLLSDDTEAHTEMPRRHRIQLLDDHMTSSAVVSAIVKKGATSKVLVVVNTVATAIALYEQLRESIEDDTPCDLVHSRFMQRHRKEKEQTIFAFGQLDNHATGIWISTQIVEVSLDIDFDYLFTECSTADSLFQRFGRCNRKGKRFNGGIPTQPNVFICTDIENASGVGEGGRAVYEKPIVENTIDALRPYDGEVLFEKVKNAIVERVFSREQLQGTFYLKTFDTTLDDLEDMHMFETNRSEAQTVLRGKMTSIQIVPADYIDKVEALIASYHAVAVDDVSIRKKIELALLSYTVSMTVYTKKDDWQLQPFTDSRFSYLYKGMGMAYSFEKGLLL